MPGPVEATSSTLEVAQDDSVCDKKIMKINLLESKYNKQMQVSRPTQFHIRIK